MKNIQGISLLIVATGISIVMVSDEKIRREIQDQGKDFLKLTKRLLKYCKKAINMISDDEKVETSEYDTSWKTALEAIESREQ